MHYTISKPIFWVTTIICGLGFSVWNFSGPMMGERMGIGGILFFTILFSPIIFGPAAGCGWLVATAYALLKPKKQIAEDRSAGKDIKSSGGVSRLTVAIMIGICFATTITPVIENHMHTIYGGVVFLTWISAFFIGTFLMFGLLHVLSRNKGSKKRDNE
jgi:hypothetical protein